mmetsp:Transcript_6532/g.13582  ORF Transcript_6532/g.13582 Transcript_6532/m.13582 type:complete len:215 (-) Transcript_6532:423-1067(-)
MQRGLSPPSGFSNSLAAFRYRTNLSKTLPDFFGLFSKLPFQVPPMGQRPGYLTPASTYGPRAYDSSTGTGGMEGLEGVERGREKGGAEARLAVDDSPTVTVAERPGGLGGGSRAPPARSVGVAPPAGVTGVEELERLSRPAVLRPLVSSATDTFREMLAVSGLWGSRCSDGGSRRGEEEGEVSVELTRAVDSLPLVLLAGPEPESFSAESTSLL